MRTSASIPRSFKNNSKTSNLGELINMKTFEHKPTKIQAVMLDKNKNIPDVVWSAFQNNTACVFLENSGSVSAKNGDFVIYGKQGWSQVMSKEEFKKFYYTNHLQLK